MICCLVPETEARAGLLSEIARACSPRIETHGERVVVFDASGLGRVIGTPREIANEVRALAASQGLGVRVAIASSSVAAWLLAHERPGVTVIDANPKATQAALAQLPIPAIATLPSRVLATVPGRAEKPVAKARMIKDALETLRRWGLKNLGQVAALSRSQVHTRLGWIGVRLHQAACGEDPEPLVPEGEPPAFLERCVLEWPIEGLEPLTFVLSRMCDALSVSLERADRGAVRITTTLQLVSRSAYQRTLNLPAPMRESKTLRTLIALDLESHPPEAAIDVVSVAVDVVPGRIVQGSLLDRAHPAPEQLATLTARLRALAGESRVGAPVVLNSHDDRGAGMQDFSVTPAAPARASTASAAASGSAPRTVLRRFRLPIAARVDVERGGPIRVFPSASSIPSGRVVDRAGPWHSSGRWWTVDRTAWDRDEWDVELSSGGCYRLARDRGDGHWEIEGEID